MDIDEIYKRKSDLELNINKLVNDFTNTTNMTIKEINLDCIYSMSLRKPINNNINVIIDYDPKI